MPLPDVSAELLRAAAARFDSEFRATPEFVDWESNLAQKFAIELEGRTYPVKKIVSLATGVPVGTFSGGDEAVEYVRKCGLKVIELPDSVHDCLEAILAGYVGARQSRLFNPRTPVIAAFKRAEKMLAARFPSGVVRTSSLEGDLDEIPWIAFVESADARTTPSGPFPIFLFRRDCSGVDVALVHGDLSNHVSGQLDEDTLSETQELRANPLVQQLGQEGFHVGDALESPPSSESRPQPDVAVVAQKLYARGRVPPDERIFQDIEKLAEVQHALRANAPSSSLSAEIHLLLRWQLDSNPDTIGEHKRIADAKGTVWWGKFGGVGMDEKWLARFRDQLVRGVPTKVFLSGGGTIWEASLKDITQDQEAVDEARLPSYYKRAQCKLFVLLSDFRLITRDWLVNHAVSAKKPTAGSVEGLLSGSAKLGYLRMTSGSDVSPPPVAPEPPPDHVPPETPPEDDHFDINDLAKQTLLDPALLTEIVDSLLNTQRQIVLAGPPGTGKTFIAQCIAEYVCRRGRELFRVVQFHPSYSYESFIEGLRPVVRAGGGIAFERTDGVVLDLVREMRDRKHIGSAAPTYLILIDEMNRANLPRVFGELMYLFEYRDKPIRLQYSPEFALPANLVFLGTMNTADRSIRSIDSALRRRFDVFELRPDAVALRGYFEKHERRVDDDPFIRNLISGFEALNKELEQKIDRHHQIGHAFFMKPGLDAKQLQAIWHRKIFPLIEEYFFDQLDLARAFTLKKFWPGLAE